MADIIEQNAGANEAHWAIQELADGVMILA